MSECKLLSPVWLCDPMDYSLPGSSPWDSPGKNTGVGCHSFLQGILPTQQSNPGLLYCKQILYLLSHQGSPDLSIDFSKSWNSQQGTFPWDSIYMKSRKQKLREHEQRTCEALVLSCFFLRAGCTIELTLCESTELEPCDMCPFLYLSYTFKEVSLF